jgi:predicted site-specific integrase-resolvase
MPHAGGTAIVQPPKKPRRVALYLRVSTGEQTTRNQRRELKAVAERRGWNVVATFEDAGVSWARGRAERPGYDKLMKAVARREIDMGPRIQLGHQAQRSSEIPRCEESVRP